MAQILNISLRLKYMETLQRASFKNSYLYQIQITLADKENPQRLQHFYQKIEEVMYLFLYNIFGFTYQRPSNGNNNESKYILLLRPECEGIFFPLSFDE